MLISLAVGGSTCEQISGKWCLVPLEAQFFQVYHTKNPRLVLGGIFSIKARVEGVMVNNLLKNAGII